MHSFWSKCGPNYGKSFNFILISLTFMFQVYVSFIHHRFNRFLLMVKVGNVFELEVLMFYICHAGHLEIQGKIGKFRVQNQGWQFANCKHL